MSENYRLKQAKRDERGNDRLVLQIAKSLLKNPSECEFELKQRKRKLERKIVDNLKTDHPPLSEYERGRIRRMKQLVWSKIISSGPVIIKLK